MMLNSSATRGSLSAAVGTFTGTPRSLLPQPWRILKQPCPTASKTDAGTGLVLPPFASLRAGLGAQKVRPYIFAPRTGRAAFLQGARLSALILTTVFAAWFAPCWAHTMQGETANPAALPGGAARLTYTRTLAGSVPEYLALRVDSDGSGSYEGRRLSDPARPRQLKLSQATTQKIFALAAQLDNFRDVDLDSRKKVANLGLKTLTYERGGQKNQVQFNFTQQKQARDLVDLFEKVAAAEQAVDSLEYAIKYDPLGLPQELLNIQIALSHDDLAEPELMVPSLEQITSNPRFLHVAQARAQDILKSVGRDK